MPLDEREVRKLREDFRSGRNPKAYIPLCQQLRREHRFDEALETCQRGLADDGRSLAGRTLLARLFSDTGRYAEALAEIARAESFAPGELGLMTIKALCQIRLVQLEDAARTLEALEHRYPMEPQVRALRGELMRRRRPPAVPHGRTASRLPAAADREPLEWINDLRRRLGAVAKMHTIGIVDLDSGGAHHQGSLSVVEAVTVWYREVAASCEEFGCGCVQRSMVGLHKGAVLAFRQDRSLVIMALDGEATVAKVQHLAGEAIAGFLSRPPGAG